MEAVPGRTTVVRFGNRGKWVEKVLRDAELALEDGLPPEVSVFCDSIAEGESAPESAHRICREVEADGQYKPKWYRFVDRETLVNRGFEPYRRPEDYRLHFNVDIGAIDIPAAERFIMSFGDQDVRYP
jgi:hypothetical protein